MYTTFDKAIVAAIMGAVQLANVLGFHFGVDEHTITSIVTMVTPVLVWVFPNLAVKDGT